MLKTKTLRIVGLVQLAFSILLAIVTVSAYLVYRSSVADISRSLAASVLSTSEVISKVAQTIRVRQELIDNTTLTLLASRKLVTEMQASTETQGKLLTQYAGNLKNASAIATDLGNTLTKVGDRLMFSVPTGARMEGYKPALTWTKPLDDQGKALKTHGESIKKLSHSLMTIADSLNNDAPRLNAAFIETCRQTLKLLDSMVKATEKLSSTDLPQAISALEVTSRNLRQASDRATDVDRLGYILLIVGLVLAGLGVCNSAGVLLIAQALAYVTAKVP